MSVVTANFQERVRLPGYGGTLCVRPRLSRKAKCDVEEGFYRESTEEERTWMDLERQIRLGAERRLAAEKAKHEMACKKKRTVPPPRPRRTGAQRLLRDAVYQKHLLIAKLVRSRARQ